MSSDTRNQQQQRRHGQVAVAFRRYAEAARRARGDEETDEMKQQRERIWELHHAITLNEGM